MLSGANIPTIHAGASCFPKSHTHTNATMGGRFLKQAGQYGAGLVEQIAKRNLPGIVQVDYEKKLADGEVNKSEWSQDNVNEDEVSCDECGIMH